MKYNKGFIGTGMIVAIIAILAIGGGVVYYSTKSPTPSSNIEENNYQPQVNQNSTTPTNTQAQNNKPSPAPVGTPTVTVISPNGGETYKIGGSITIKWWDNNDAGNRNILITDLTHNSPGAEFMIQYNEFVRSSGIDGTYSKLWKINNIPAGKYKIQVCKSGTNECDFSDNYFTITPSTTTANPSITIISPNGGEVWKMSEQKSVKWTSSGLSNNAEIGIRLRSESDFFDFCDPIDGKVSAKQGTFIITPATTICVGKTSSLPEDRFKLSAGRYKIEIGVTNYGGGKGIVDTSDNYFTISN